MARYAGKNAGKNAGNERRKEPVLTIIKGLTSGY